MAIDPKLKTQAMAKLRLGESARKVAEDLKISYGSVNRWQKELYEENEEDNLDTLLSVTPEVLQGVADKVKEKAPPMTRKEIDKLVDGAVGLQKIDEKFRTVVYELLEWAEMKSQDKDLSINEWKTIGTTISSMYTAIFNKNVTNVNVMNQTSISTEKRDIFKASLRS